jgi:hypothetical protein
VEICEGGGVGRTGFLVGDVVGDSIVAGVVQELEAWSVQELVGQSA